MKEEFLKNMPPQEYIALLLLKRAALELIQEDMRKEDVKKLRKTTK